MRALNFDDAPARLRETWEWFCAVYAYDYADPEPLAELLRSGAVPPEYRGVIANIVAGQRKPNRKAGAKLKIPAREHMKIAGSISVVLGLCETFKHEEIYTSLSDKDRAPNAIGDRDGVEPISVVRDLERTARETIAEAAQELGVSVETIENLLREMRRRVAAWPEV